MEYQLTKDSELLLLLVCQNYLASIKEGKSKRDAKQLGSAELIKSQCPSINSWHLSDVQDSCDELVATGFFLKKAYYGGTQYSLSDQSVIYIENKFQNDLKTILDAITNIKKLFF